LDSVSEIYSYLSEDDLFYGLWRRRSAYQETNAALAFEHIGMFDKAQSMYENAQQKARGGLLPFSSGEYGLWQDRWILASEKLQQW
jgi:transformation/transcription domain-associated protein